ncbi:Protein EMBRYO DEFECTIVE like [Actinidia chinensis var. chinensis]|uniref:Protein EMBRYO DEFECTIVE like n=1 Tax=Actinidia chinensis var. chinensis TaxID=1590841 RepID=A0A2R6S080_ACTCC|nr:Protein EMBRYO DEFECTIVE like [Actinidia chinensis var. chinensis]
MASQSTATANSNRSQKIPPNTSICSSFLKSVFLHDWWLIRADTDSEGRRLGVGGFASRERQGIRSFRSATIAKRHDTVTLETADGITITIIGFINRSLTLENGFPSEVCNHFIFGFPYNWEKYSTRCFGEQSVNKASPSKISSFSDDGTDSFSPVLLDDLPVTRVRDLLMSDLGDSGDCGLAKSILNDILQKYGGNAFKRDRAPVQPHVQSSKTINSLLDVTVVNRNKTMGAQKRKHDNGIHPLLTSYPVHDGTPTKTKIEEKSKDDDAVLYATDTGIAEHQSSSRGVTTRSMTRQNNLKNKNFSQSTFATQRHGEPFSGTESSSNPFSGRESSSNPFGRTVNKKNSNLSPTTKLCDTDVEITGMYTARRCTRQEKSIDRFSASEASTKRSRWVAYRNCPDAWHENVISGELDGKQIFDNSSVRRSNRLRTIQHKATSNFDEI